MRIAKCNLFNKFISPRSCAEVLWTRGNSILLMDALQKKVGDLGRTFVQKGIHSHPAASAWIDEKIFGLPVLEEEEDPRLFAASMDALIKRHCVEYRPVDAIADTLGLSSKIIAYGIFCKGITSLSTPLEKWNFFALMFGPWWSSAFWVEWVCYDFFRSAFARIPTGEHKDIWVKKWCPYEMHPEINWAYKNNRKCFYFCASIIISLYAAMLHIRPRISQILWQKLHDSWRIRCTKKEALELLDFLKTHREEIFSKMPAIRQEKLNLYFRELDFRIKQDTDLFDRDHWEHVSNISEKLFELIEDLPAYNVYFNAVSAEEEL